jgi:hypothetical protein
MKSRVACLAALMTLALTAVARDEKPAPQLRLEVELLDGSRIVGAPAIATVALQTPCAKIDIPFDEVRQLQENGR